jgi:TolA-binding protein
MFGSLKLEERMSCNLKTVAITLLILVSLTSIRAQAQESVSGGQPKTVVFLDSTKEQEGLSGAVRRMRVESARLELKSGKLTEGPRQLMEVTAYDVKGNRIENVSYPLSASSAGKEEYKYDKRGNVTEMTLRGDDGSILSKERYEYEYDKVGNWTKMMTSLVVFEGGELKLEPVEVTYRSFSYYFNDTVEKILSANSPTTLQLTESPKSVAGIEPAKDSDSAESSLQVAQPMIVVPAADNSLASDFNGKTREISSPETTLASDQVTSKPINKSPAAESPGESQTTVVPLLSATSSHTVNTKPVDVPVLNPTIAETNKGSETAETHSQPKEVETRFLGRSSKFDDRSPSESTTQPSSESNGVANSLPGESARSVANEAAPSPVNVVKISSEEQPKRLPASAAGKAIDEVSTGGDPGTSADTQNALALYALGRNRFDSGDFEGAVDAFKQSIKLNPEFAEYQLSLAHSYMQLKKNGDAIKALKQAIHLNPDSAEAHYGLGLMYFNTNRHTDAMLAFKRVVKLAPDMPKAHYGLAMTYVELRNNDELLREYRILQKLDRDLAKKVAQSFPEFNLPCRVAPHCK